MSESDLPAMTCFQISIPDVGRGPCVYFLFDGDELIYIGQTANLIRRLGEHLVSGKRFDRIGVIACRESELLSIERHWIKKLKPPLNSLPEIDRELISRWAATVEAARKTAERLRTEDDATKPITERPITALDLPKGPLHCLIAGGFTTVADVLAVPADRVLQTRGFGGHALGKLDISLRRHGIGRSRDGFYKPL